MAVKVSGTKGNDRILLDSGNDTINAGSGNDWIYAGSGNDVITGGKGNNIIYFNSIDVPNVDEHFGIPLYDATMGHDTINLTSGENLILDCSEKILSEAKVVGKDIVLSFGENESITLKNFASKDVVGSKGSVLLKLKDVENPIDLKLYLDYLGNDFNSKGVYNGAWLSEIIDASYLNSQEAGFGKEGINGVSIKAGAGDDVITGSIFNDTITGGTGQNIINIDLSKQFGEDTIVLTKNEDLVINITGSTSQAEALALLNNFTTSVAGKDFVVKFYSDSDKTQEIGSIKIKDFVAKNVVGEDGSVVIKVGEYASFDLTKEEFKISGHVLEDRKMLHYGTEEDITSWVNKGVINGTRLGEMIDAHLYEAKKADKGVSIKAGAGDDAIKGSEFKDTIYGGDGVDYIDGGDGIDKIYGDKDNDYLVGGLGKDSIYGGDGDDEITAGIDTDDDTWGTDTDGNYVDGGKGDDWIYGSNQNDTLKGGDGNDFIWTFGGNDLVYGGNGHDALVSEESGASTLYGEKGNDHIEVKYDGDIAYGGDGDDMINIGFNTITQDPRFENTDKVNAIAYGGKGNDVISIHLGGATVKGDAGNDVIYGSRTAASDIIFAKGDGNDVYKYMAPVGDTLVFDNISTSALSFDFVEGTVRKDKFYNEGVWTENSEKQHNDLVITYGKNQSVAIEDYTSDMNIYIQTNDGGKQLLSDMLNAEFGTTKSDKIETEKDFVFAAEGNDQITSTSNNANIYTGAGNDSIILTGEKSLVCAGSGNDMISVSTGENKLYGEAGNDKFIVEGGTNTIETGDGKNTVIITNDWKIRDKESDVVAGETTVIGGAGNDTFKVGQGTFTVDLTGGAGADTFDLSDTWHYDAYFENQDGVLDIQKGSNITINDFSNNDTLILRRGTVNNMLGTGQQIGNEYSKYSMFFDVSLDADGSGIADLSKIMFAMEDKDTVLHSYNAETGKIETSIVIKTADEHGSILDSGKILVRDTNGKTVKYKFNEVFINQVTEEVAKWLSTNGYSSVADAMADFENSGKDVLGVFVDASLQLQEDGTLGGLDILVRA